MHSKSSNELQKASKPRNFFQGIRARVAVFVFITASCSLFLSSYLISERVMSFHRREFDTQLYNLALDLSEELRVDFFGNPAPPITGLSFGKRILPFRGDRSFFQVLNGDGEILYRSTNLGRRSLPWAPIDFTQLLTHDVVFHTVSAEKVGMRDRPSFRIISVPISEGKILRGIFQMAVPMDIIEREKEQLNGLFAVLIPVLVGSLAFGSYWIAGRALLPLRELIARARGITPEDLSVRVPEPETSDEVAELSQTLNGLLARIQSAFDSQERFIADASHQLKTPLAVMQGEIELLQQRNPSADEIRTFLKSAHEEVRHLAKLVQGLLILARVSALPEAALVKTTVRLDEVLLGLLERYQVALKTRGIKCRFQADEEGDFEVQGDEDLLRSLFETLIENAVKYSPESGVVDVELKAENDRVRVLVRDSGSGIPESLKEKVFERFYRAETGTQGFGLGLTIARQIARAHGADISIASRENESMSGTCVLVEMKKNS